MKLLRFALAFSLLLLAASPSFALPCSSCTAPDPPYCESTPGSGTRCLFHIDWCEDKSAPLCNGLMEESATAVLAEWTVSSIEVSRPAEGTKVVTAPGALVEADVHQSVLLK